MPASANGCVSSASPSVTRWSTSASGDTTHGLAVRSLSAVASAGDVIALATADKLRTASPWVVARLADVDHLVTDGGAELTRPFAAAGIDVVAA